MIGSVNQAISLRAAKEEDYEFLYRLHRETLRDAIDQTWGWDEGWQAHHFREKFDIARKKIIQQDDIDIGCLEVRDKGDHIFIAYIALMPPYQNQGIGSKLIEAVLDEAHRRNVPVELKVLRRNPAHTLYRRLGFKVIETSSTHYFLRFDPN